MQQAVACGLNVADKPVGIGAYLQESLLAFPTVEYSGNSSCKGGRRFLSANKFKLLKYFFCSRVTRTFMTFNSIGS